MHTGVLTACSWSGPMQVTAAAESCYMRATAMSCLADSILQHFSPSFSLCSSCLLFCDVLELGRVLMETQISH